MAKASYPIVWKVSVGTMKFYEFYTWKFNNDHNHNHHHISSALIYNFMWLCSFSKKNESSWEQDQILVKKNIDIASLKENDDHILELCLFLDRFVLTYLFLCLFSS